MINYTRLVEAAVAVLMAEQKSPQEGPLSPAEWMRLEADQWEAKADAIDKLSDALRDLAKQVVTGTAPEDFETLRAWYRLFHPETEKGDND